MANTTYKIIAHDKYLKHMHTGLVRDGDMDRDMFMDMGRGLYNGGLLVKHHVTLDQY